MNKDELTKIRTIVNLVFIVLALLLMGATLYQHVCIRKFASDVQELNDDVMSLHRDIQEMKYDLKSVNKTLDFILRELWLSRPPVPEDYLPMPALKEE